MFGLVKAHIWIPTGFSTLNWNLTSQWNIVFESIWQIFTSQRRPSIVSETRIHLSWRSHWSDTKSAIIYTMIRRNAKDSVKKDKHKPLQIAEKKQTGAWERGAWNDWDKPSPFSNQISYLTNFEHTRMNQTLRFHFQPFPKWSRQSDPLMPFCIFLSSPGSHLIVCT
jgi:hypothetical protein